MFMEDNEDDTVSALAEFSVWKWKVLQRRREFFVPLLAAANLFLWAYLTTLAFEKDVPVSTKGIVFTCTQASGLLVLGLLLTPRNKSVLKGNFGYKVCILLGLSIFPFIYVVKKFAKTGMHFTEANGAIVSAFVSMSWLTCIHHIGLTEMFTWSMSLVVMLMWCLYVNGRDRLLNSPGYVSVVLGCGILAFCSSLVEAEYRHMYALQNEAVERSLNDVTFIEDVASVLRQMGRLLQRVRASHLGSATGAVAGTKGGGSKALTTVNISPGSVCSSLAYADYLCSSLFGAATLASSTDDDYNKLSQRSDVDLMKLCAGAIEKMETARGRGCTMYYDTTSAEVCINSKKYFLELIFLLLTENSSTSRGPPSFCLFSFQSVNSNLQITMRRTSIETQNVAAMSVANGGHALTDTDGSEASELSEEAFLQTLVAEKNQTYGAYDSARFRLADRIARKHLKSKVDMSTPESKHGLSMVTLRLVIPGPVSMPSIAQNESMNAKTANVNMFHLNPWYVVDYYKSTEDRLANIKVQLDVLSVPWKSVHAYHFSNMKAKTQVAVVHEIWFRSHKEKVFQEVFSLARAVILVSSDSDAPKSFQYSPDDGPARLIKVSASISSRDLFNAIQSLIAKLKPLSAPQSSIPPPVHSHSTEVAVPSTRPPSIGEYHRQPSVLSDMGRNSTETGPGLRQTNSHDSLNRESLNQPTNDKPPTGDGSHRAFVGYLPMLHDTESEAEQQLEDSVLQTRFRNMDFTRSGHSSADTANGGVPAVSLATSDSGSAGDFFGSGSGAGGMKIGTAGSSSVDDPQYQQANTNSLGEHGSFMMLTQSQKIASQLEPAQDQSLDAVKHKWILLMDRLEFEVFVNIPNAAVRSLKMDDEEAAATVTGGGEANSVEKKVSSIYQGAMEQINACGLGNYLIIAKNFVDVLQKQRMAKDKNWVFACLPYQQRVAKLMADEFILPLGAVRRAVQEGQCDIVADGLRVLENKGRNMGMDPLGTWFAIAVDVVELLQAHYPGAEPFGGGIGGVTRGLSVIDSNSRPSTAITAAIAMDSSVHGSGVPPLTPTPTQLQVSKKESGGTPSPFRSTTTALLRSDHVESQNTEIRKILLNMFDLIEVTLWTSLANMMRLCDEDAFAES